MMGFPRVLDVLLLISLAVSYIVLCFANKEEKGLRLIGFFIGSLILALTIAYIVGNLLWQNKLCNAKAKYYQGMMQSAPKTQRQMK